MLKVRLLRQLLRVLVFATWRRTAPRNLSVETQSIPVAGGEIRVRRYTPEGQGPFPIIVYYHGGGFVLGSIDSQDSPCRDLCANTGHVVVSVDYRLAPECPYPHAARDAAAALDWVVGHGEELGGDTNRIVVAGDSAGGNLAAIAAIHARDTHPGVLKGQLLIYPVTHHYSHATPSYSEFARSRALSRKMMMWFWDLYLGTVPVGDAKPELALPLAVEDLSRLPPALLLLAERDPLRDEGLQYADALRGQGVRVQCSVYAGQQHGFYGLLGPTAAHHRATREIVSWLQPLA